jgi:hypothetical protein
VSAYAKQHYRLVRGRWACRDAFGLWWQMPFWWAPGDSIEGFVWR